MDGSSQHGQATSADAPGGGADATQANDQWSSVTTRAETASRPGLVETPTGTLRFLNVSGDRVGMAAQVGARLKHDIHRGVLPYFATLVERTVRRSPAKRLAKTVSWGAHQAFTRHLRQRLPDAHQRALYALSDAAELPARVVFDASLMPETLLWLVGSYHRLLGTSPSLGLGQPPAFGCSSIVVAPPRAEGLLHGRNLDYFGVDIWERQATITFYHPDDALDYVAIATAGVWGGGITAMNAAGLTLAVHEHVVGELDRDGVPIGLAGDEVMRRAHTIEEAVEVLREHPPIGGWTYVMSEGDTGRAAVFEVVPGHDALSWMRQDEAGLAYANTFWDEAFRERAVDHYPEHARASLARQARMASLLRGETLRDGTTPEAIARVLGDMHDPTGSAETERAVGRTIANLATVGSVVFEPKARRVWVAAGSSPASRGWYVPFVLRAGGPGGVDTSVAPMAPFAGWEETPEGQAFALYRQAHLRALDGEGDDRLTVLIEHALALHNQDPNLHVLAGLLAMRTGRLRRAEGAFQRALELTEAPARRAEIKLYLAWTLDLLDRRKDARHLYKQIAADTRADEITRSRARQHRWVRMQPEAAARLPLDFIHASVA